MLKKPCMVLKNDEGADAIKVYGNGHSIPIEYKIPEWADDEEGDEACFQYLGNTYFLSEIIRLEDGGIFKKAGFNGSSGWTWFSGILVKLADDGESLKAYNYCES